MRSSQKPLCVIARVEARGVFVLLEGAAGVEARLLGVERERRADQDARHEAIVEAGGDLRGRAGLAREARTVVDLQARHIAADPAVEAERAAHAARDRDLVADRRGEPFADLHRIFGEQRNLRRRIYEARVVVAIDALADRGEMLVVANSRVSVASFDARLAASPDGAVVGAQMRPHALVLPRGRDAGRLACPDPGAPLAVSRMPKDAGLLASAVRTALLSAGMKFTPAAASPPHSVVVVERAQRARVGVAEVLVEVRHDDVARAARRQRRDAADERVRGVRHVGVARRHAPKLSSANADVVAARRDEIERVADRRRRMSRDSC